MIIYNKSTKNKKHTKKKQKKRKKQKMAKVSLDAVEQFSEQNQNSNNVSFFSLKNDGDEAVVRFMYDSVDEFEILTFHSVPVVGSDGRSRDIKVSCNRSLNEAPEKCPLCAAGNKLIQRFFIKMLQYVPDGAGHVTVRPVIWERSTQYALKLREYLNNYGPLSDLICKVIRHGAAGSMQTTYEIIPNLNKNIYPDNVYVKDPSVISTYSALGTLVKDKSSEDMYTYLQTGAFPAVAAQTEVVPEFPAGTIENPQFNNVPNYQSSGYVPPQQGYTFSGPANDFTNVQQQAQAQVVQSSVTQAQVPSTPTQQQIPQQRMPWQNQGNAVQRPIRSY